MEFEESMVNNKPYKTYWFNKDGVAWLGSQLGMIIKDIGKKF